MLNEILHHVGMLWIICSNDEIKYEIEVSNHQYWLNKGPWYNTAIWSSLHGILFEYFITHARTDRYNLMCSLVAHDKKQPAQEDEEISIGDRLIPKNATTEALESLGATLNFIYVWLKPFEANYEVRSVIYNKAMKQMFKQIPTTIYKPISAKEKSINL